MDKLLRIAAHWLDQIRSVWRDPSAVRVTLIVRAVADPSGDSDVVITDEADPEDAIGALRKRWAAR